MMGKLAAGIAALTLTLTPGASAAPAPYCPQVAAHRGASDTGPENTLPALVSAAKAGADYVEFDVRWTKSSVAVLLHDATVDRTTNGTGAVSSKWYYQVAGLDAGSKFSPAYAGARVPTLGSALRALAPYRAQALPELKGYPTDTQLASFVRTIRSNGMAGRVVVQSFSASNLRRLHAVAPEVPLALLTSTAPADPVAAAQSAHAGYWLPYYPTATAGAVAQAHAAGIRVLPWTADTDNEWSDLASAGADAIITDRASTYSGWKMAHCGL